MPGSGGPEVRAVRGPFPPTSRPTWLLVLSSITLIYGGLLLVSGLTALRDPVAAARLPITQPLPPAQEALSRRLSDVGTRIIAGHDRGIRGRAIASLVLALLMLYSAAAALSRDRHGRTVTLAAAWLGIVYQVGSLPVVIPIARDYATAAAPVLAEMVAAEPVPKATAPAKTDEAEPPRPEVVAQVMQSVFVGIPIVTALVGISGSLLLIVYFGGRRGRALYGLGPVPPPG